jgi:hypothetical protein
MNKITTAEDAEGELLLKSLLSVLRVLCGGEFLSVLICPLRQV